MALNTNEQEEAYRVGAQLKIAKDASLLTDATVTAANTVAGIRAAIAAAVLPVGSSEMVRSQTLRAITAGVDLGFLTDAAILSLTTMDQFIALSGIATEYKGRSFYD